MENKKILQFLRILHAPSNGTKMERSSLNEAKNIKAATQ